MGARALHKKLHISSSLLGSENWDKPLTGKLFALSAFDLVYLLFELEKAYNIRIPEWYFKNYSFNTVNAIAEAILRCDEQV